MIASTVLFSATISPLAESVVPSIVALRMSVPETKPTSSPPSTTGSWWILFSFRRWLARFSVSVRPTVITFRVILFPTNIPGSFPAAP